MSAGDISKRKEAPIVTFNKLQMEAMVSEIMKIMEKTGFFQQKHADDFSGNVSHVHKDAKNNHINRFGPGFFEYN